MIRKNSIFSLLLKEESGLGAKIIVYLIISGVANAMLLFFVNEASSYAESKELLWHLFVFYLISLSVFVYTQRYALIKVSEEIDSILTQIRLRLIEKIMALDLRSFELFDRASLIKPLTDDGNTISYAAIIIVQGIKSMIMVSVVLIYLFILSVYSAIISLLVISFAVYIYIKYNKSMASNIQESYKIEKTLFNQIRSQVDGFKEIKINRNKNRDLFNFIIKTSDHFRTIRQKVGIDLVSNVMFSQISFYTLLMVLVFIVPLFDSKQNEIIFEISATILFIIGPVNNLVNSSLLMVKVHAVIKEIYSLEAAIDGSLNRKERSVIPLVAAPLIEDNFKTITLNGVGFSYLNLKDESLFDFGPVNFEFNQGELIFIIGGNGSGKSTLLKLLTGLYQPSCGHILVNGFEIGAQEEAYRNLFATIFTDYHLFNRLYGLDQINEERVHHLLDELGLKGKTSYRRGRFTYTNLSTGQRKRLALIAALLEDKPIYIFDEIAADQDPQFKRYFYYTMLPQLKKAGKTVIAVTHDDHYFAVADKLFKMDEGLITLESQPRV